MSLSQLIKRTWAKLSPVTFPSVVADYDTLEIVEEHMHSVGFVRPTGAADVTLTSGAGAWTLGNFFQIIAAGDITDIYDIHWCELASPDTNATYEIVFYGTVSGVADVEVDRIRFVRSNVQVRSFQKNVHMVRLDAGSVLRVKMMDSTGGSQVDISVHGHRY